jgi:tRNA 2-thiouridine synthesizing protein A
MSSDRLLDATGLRCPLPVLKARKALKEMASGQVLEVRATDAAAPKDFRAFCEMTGDALLAADDENGVFVFRIAKA